MKKAFFLVTIIMLIVCSLAGCVDDIVIVDPLELVNTLTQYAISKGQDNYSEQNWAIINSIVDQTIEAMNSAKSQSEIEDIVNASLDEIDKVEPNKSDTIEDGAYRLTDNSWLYMVRTIAKEFGKDKQWVQSAMIDGEYTYQYNGFDFTNNKNYYWVTVVGEQATLSNKGSNAVYMLNEDGIYEGEGVGFGSTAKLWLLKGVLYFKTNVKFLQFALDDTYTIDDTPKNIDAPSGVRVEEYSLSWDYSKESLSAPFWCAYAKIDVKYPGATQYVAVGIEYPVGGACPDGYIAYYKDLQLQVGVNELRISYVGCSTITNDNKIITGKSSDYYYLTLIIDEAGNVTAENE